MEARLATRLDQNGYVRVTASDTRSQLQNRRLAESRLADLLRRALRVERARRKTAPSAGARRARLEDKRKQSEKKATRRRPSADE